MGTPSRASSNGKTVASQATNVGSIPIARSNRGHRGYSNLAFTRIGERALWAVFSHK